MLATEPGCLGDSMRQAVAMVGQHVDARAAELLYVIPQESYRSRNVTASAVLAHAPVPDVRRCFLGLLDADGAEQPVLPIDHEKVQPEAGGLLLSLLVHPCFELADPIGRRQVGVESAPQGRRGDVGTPWCASRTGPARHAPCDPSPRPAAGMRAASRRSRPPAGRDAALWFARWGHAPWLPSGHWHSV